jgi:DNA-binding response OmpR family regulator
VELARSAEHARILARTGAPDALLLGGLGGPRAPLALLEEVRFSDSGLGWWPRMPAIVLGSGRHGLELVRSFEAGADDFLARPARYIELRLRLRALLLRGAARRPERRRLAVGPLAVDMRARAVTLGDRHVPLCRLEFDLLAHLAREPERVFARPELLAAVWGYRAAVPTRTVDSHASRLRIKLAGGAACPGRSVPATRWVFAVRGVGYRLI